MTVLMGICTVPIAGLAAYAFQHREKHGARGLLLALVGLVGWIVMLALLSWPGTVLPLHVNATIRHTCQFMVGFGWLLFVAEYVRQERVDVRRWYVPVVLAVPVATILLTATNPIHHAIIAEGTPTNPAGVADFELGPWYPLFIGYAVALVTLPAVWLAYELRSAHGPYRKQLYLILAGWGIGVPGALNVHVLRWFDSIPPFVDLTPFAFVIAATLWGVALFRYRLFGMVPVSRRRAVEQMDDAVISVDAHGTVVDANPAALALCEVDSSAVGTPLQDLCEHLQPVLELYERGGEQNTEVAVDFDGRRRHFSVRVAPVEMGQSASGSLIVLRETTRLQERERELDLLKQVFSRVFRHNIRNELTVLEGHATAIEAADEADRFDEHTDEILETVDRLLAHSEKATELRDVIDEETAEEPVDLAGVTRNAVDDFTSTRPSVEVDTRIEAGVFASPHPHLRMAISEVLGNAAAHFDGDPADLRIRVVLASEDGHARIVVADNGAGIDDQEAETLAAGEETALQHASGVGLWMVRMVAERSGGSLTIDRDGELGGARIALSIPLVDEPDSG